MLPAALALFATIGRASPHPCAAAEQQLDAFVAARVEPHLVRVTATGASTMRTGTGYIVQWNPVIVVTAFHVVRGASEITVHPHAPAGRAPAAPQAVTLVHVPAAPDAAVAVADVAWLRTGRSDALQPTPAGFADADDARLATACPSAFVRARALSTAASSSNGWTAVAREIDLAHARDDFFRLVGLGRSAGSLPIVELDGGRVGNGDSGAPVVAAFASVDGLRLELVGLLAGNTVPQATSERVAQFAALVGPAVPPRERFDAPDSPAGRRQLALGLPYGAAVRGTDLRARLLVDEVDVEPLAKLAACTRRKGRQTRTCALRTRVVQDARAALQLAAAAEDAHLRLRAGIDARGDQDPQLRRHLGHTAAEATDRSREAAAARGRARELR